MADKRGEERIPTEDQMQLFLWQKADFLDTGHAPSDKADSLRLKLAQLEFYRLKKLITLPLKLITLLCPTQY